MVSNTSRRVNVSSHRYAPMMRTGHEWRNLSARDEFGNSAEVWRLKKPNGDCDDDRHGIRVLREYSSGFIFIGL